MPLKEKGNTTKQKREKKRRLCKENLNAVKDGRDNSHIRRRKWRSCSLKINLNAETEDKGEQLHKNKHDKLWQ